MGEEEFVWVLLGGGIFIARVHLYVNFVGGVHSAAAAMSISSIIDCGWMVVVVCERMRVRPD